MNSITGATHLIKSLKARRRGPRRKHKAYRDRDEAIGLAGYASYQEYLKSDQWRELRADKLARFPMCLLCDRKASQVHHLAYTHDVLLGFSPNLLVTLCRECHEAIEFDACSVKRSLEEANAELKRRAADIGHHGWLKMIRHAFQKSKRILSREQTNAIKRENASDTLHRRCKRRKPPERKLPWLCAMCKTEQIRTGITCERCRIRQAR